jgi:hypothetical protein
MSCSGGGSEQTIVSSDRCSKMGAAGVGALAGVVLAVIVMVIALALHKGPGWYFTCAMIFGFALNLCLSALEIVPGLGPWLDRFSTYPLRYIGNMALFFAFLFAMTICTFLMSFLS